MNTDAPQNGGQKGNHVLPENTEKPWGFFRTFTINSQSTVKVLHVNAGEEFSLQRHAHRSEFWRVISGSPFVTIGEKKVQAKIGDEFNIPAGVLHRISALEEDAEVLEVSTGQFDENDIERLEDKYGRI